MALTETEEALLRELLAEKPELDSLADNEAAIISKLGGTKIALADLTAALAVNGTDLTLIVQDGTAKNSTVGALVASIGTYGSAKIYGTYAAASAASHVAGDAVIVFGDAGTHTDPVVGGTVPNEGIYIYSASPAGLEWVSPVLSQSISDAVADAEAAAASAEAASGPTYASTAAGLAATTNGQNFAVDNGDGTVTVYRNDAGVAVSQRNLATVAYNDARYANKESPEFPLSGSFSYAADFFNPTDDYVRTDLMVRATDAGSHAGKIRFGQFISASSEGTSPNGPANAFVAFGVSNLKKNFLTSTSTQETDGLFAQTKTGRFGDTSAFLADAWAVNVPGVSTSFANLIEGAAGCFNTSGSVVSKIRFQAANQYQAGTPGTIEGVGCHIIAEVGTQVSALDISNTPGTAGWTNAFRLIADTGIRYQILGNGYTGINGIANSQVPLLINAHPDGLTQRHYFAEDGSGLGPVENFFRYSASPANNDLLGNITFDGMNSAAAQKTYAAIRAQAVNVGNGTEQGGLFGFVTNAGTLAQSFAAFKDSFYIAGPLSILGTQVLGPRKTGWSAATGTATRTTYATGTVTTAQLAERLKALIDDLISHGVIGA